MKVEVLRHEDQGKQSWLVCTSSICVPFGSEQEAIQYADTLSARLNAPHEWPVFGCNSEPKLVHEADERPALEHA